MSSSGEEEQTINDGAHTNNWAVLVCTSTFWFNYRHVANVLSVYHIIKRMGISDDHIIIMLADDMACNPRNPYPAKVFNHYDHKLNVYDEHVEVDYRGSEVTVNNFLRLLTNRLPEGTPNSKRLLTDNRSNILIYMTGHGGDNFLKFQDSEEINAHDLADAFDQMHERKRYNQILFMVDTCQASTMNEFISAPGITAIASSIRGESSYSYQVDDDVGVAVLDRFTWALLEFTKNMDSSSSQTIADLFNSLDPNFLASHADLKQTPETPSPDQLKITDFFGNVRAIDSDIQPIYLQSTENENETNFRQSIPKFSLPSHDLFKENKNYNQLKSSAQMNLEIDPFYTNLIPYISIVIVLFSIIKICLSSPKSALFMKAKKE